VLRFILFILLFVAGSNIQYLLATILLTIPVAVLYIFRHPYQVKRIVAFLFPELYKNDIAFQLYQSLIAIGSGGLWGRGLGDRFLRHVERTRVLVHLVDIAGAEGRDPVEDFHTINRELMNYSRKLIDTPQVIAANKMDLQGAAENLRKFKKAVRKKVYPISALKKKGG